MKQRLTHKTQELTEEELAAAQDQWTEEFLTFDSADDMIRHDAAHTVVPPQIRDRVMQSITRETIQDNPAPWWKRWMPF
jgi:hypothetical protein